MNLLEINKFLRDKSPVEIVQWGVDQAATPVVTTNFRPYEAAILYVCAQVLKDLPVIWCDTGYNTPQTYKYAQTIIHQLNLNVHLFAPLQTTAYREAIMGIPAIDDPLHATFTEQVKLEPFRRALKTHQPDVWFTNLRQGQTAFRDDLDIVSQGQGMLKIAPFYYWSDKDLDTFLETHHLANDFKYFDPTKALDNRECGLHTQ